MIIKSKLSVWIAVVSIVLTAMITLATFHNYLILAFIILLNAGMIWQARHEGRIEERELHRQV